jgi:hypothetical protein
VVTFAPDMTLWLLAMICPVLMGAVGAGLWWSGTHPRVGQAMVLAAALTAAGIGVIVGIAYSAAMQFRGGTRL